MLENPADSIRRYFEPQKIVLSYSHRDSKLFQSVRGHLFPLKREGLIGIWSDIELTAGSPLAAEIILLISSSFISSDFWTDLKRS